MGQVRKASALAIAVAAAWLAPLTFPVAAGAESLVTMQFRLAASDGYTLQVKTEGDRAQVSVWRGEEKAAASRASGTLEDGSHGLFASATYYVDNAATPGAIDADLGPLGAIHVRFVPSGKTRIVRIPRGKVPPGCRAPRRLRRVLGSFEGTISFQGDNGFTQVEAGRAEGTVSPSARRRCGGSETLMMRRAGAPHLPQVEHVWVKSNAYLFSRNLSSRDSSNMTWFEALATDDVIHYFVSRVEVLSSGLSARRSVVVVGPGAGFTYSRDLGKATLRPPAPFSGEAAYARSGHRLRGDLAVALPGIDPVPLAGWPFEARIAATP